MAEWTNVKDKLPERGQEVLVWDDDDYEFYVAWLDEKENTWWGNEIGEIYGVTFWMPIPELPEEVSE